jgi:hypothetical protein
MSQLYGTVVTTPSKPLSKPFVGRYHEEILNSMRIVLGTSSYERENAMANYFSDFDMYPAYLC